MKKWFAAAAIAATTAAALSGAMSVRPMSVFELTRAAECVVLADVASVRSEWAGGGVIVTYVTLDVRECWKGAPTSRVVLRVPGGTIGSTRLHVPEAPRFSAGETTTVFLRSVVVDGVPSVETVGWFRGKLTVVGDSVRELRDVTVASLRSQVEAASKD